MVGTVFILRSPLHFLILLAAVFSAPFFIDAVFSTAFAQADGLGRLIAPPSGARVTPGTQTRQSPKATTKQYILHQLTVSVGQTVAIRAGIVALRSRPSDKQIIVLEKEPDCGEAKVAKDSVVYYADPECVGRKVNFEYVIGYPRAPGAGFKKQLVKVRAAVLSGIETCGISDAPFRFLLIKGGKYSIADAPRPLADLAGLLDTADFEVAPFCITEEAIARSEFDFLVLNIPISKIRAVMPEALSSLPHQRSISITTGRTQRLPATQVSLAMARTFAEEKSEMMEQELVLPSLEQYIAAAWELHTNRPDAPETHSFLVSLRGGLLEWTKTACQNKGTYVVLGPRLDGSRIEKYCFESTRRGSRSGFRLVAPAPDTAH